MSGEALPGRTTLRMKNHVDAIAPLVPEGAEAITGQAQADETQDQLSQALGFVTTFLLVFAGVALFVGAFIIFNTFSMLVAQRTRELALLRAVGASRNQVTLSVLGESLLVGLVGSLAGTVAYGRLALYALAIPAGIAGFLALVATILTARATPKALAAKGAAT